MANSATIQAHVAAGFAKVADKLGAPCQWYRPAGAHNPLSTNALLGTLQAAIDTTAILTMRAPPARAKPEQYYLACDTSLIAVGDYLVDDAQGTFFISALGGYAASRLVSCNATVNVYRPSAPATGAGFYGGVATETLLMTAWPVAIVQGTKGEQGKVHLPGDTRNPWFSILMPYAGVEIRTGDVLLDTQAIPGRYIVSSTELTSLGWRLSAALATP